ncbi:MAG: hypothetical protein GEU82_12580 [Luteitalea sp.]|nr:hypothetical protein [Luteitalea sp.]
MVHGFRRSAACLVTAIVIIFFVASSPAIGQSETTAAAKSWDARTPDGQPDFQGVWNFSTPTPLERPSKFSGREFLTDEEVEALGIEAASRDRRAANAQADVGQAYNEFWSERGKPTKRTSLILDPADGKLPPLTPEGQQRAAALRGAGGERGADSWEDRSLWERCLTRGGLPRIPGSYNNNVQIFQIPGHVVLLYEMIHEARIIPTDGRPHLDTAVRQWLGDSRGRWEGQTLVVETTNFTDRTSFRGSSENMRLVERFTRIDADTIDYRFTVEDPATFTRPWTATLPLTRIDGHVYEYACHEGNYGMRNLLTGHRAEEKAAADAAKKD